MRGSILDLPIVVIVLAVFFVALFVGLLVYNQFAERDFWQTTEVGQHAFQQADIAYETLDYSFLFILIGAFMATVISAFFIETHPIFFIVSLIVLIIFIVITPAMTNAFMGVAASPRFSTEAAELNIATQAMGNLPLILTVFGFILIIVLYAKRQGGAP